MELTKENAKGNSRTLRQEQDNPPSVRNVQEIVNDDAVPHNHVFDPEDSR
jgi:hypothetical protein